jgi:hypothetical protein
VKIFKMLKSCGQQNFPLHTFSLIIAIFFIMQFFGRFTSRTVAMSATATRAVAAEIKAPAPKMAATAINASSPSSTPSAAMAAKTVSQQTPMSFRPSTFASFI